LRSFMELVSALIRVPAVFFDIERSVR
jgi:hypothetical protein